MRRWKYKLLKVFLFTAVLFLLTQHYLFSSGRAQWEEKNLNEGPETFSDSEHVAWYCGQDLKDITLKDYHDLEQMAKDKKRSGPGEQGRETTTKEKRFTKRGLNIKVSEKISLDRSLNDIRHTSCRQKEYLSALPTVSVVIPLCDEHWNTLLRTVHSVLNRSPTNVLKEIILVDDFSENKQLKKPLDDHVADNYDGRVQLLHTERREGLIRARLLGARHATGQVLVFLDSHVEANYNWLPPLLEPIARNYKTVTCPFIDVIEKETFKYHAQDEGARGAFDWQLYYKRLPKLPRDRQQPAEPFESPVMAGGLFAISTKWFWELGGYDAGLEIWGGEQYELSFKIWQCGGQMYDIPCSRVGHIYGAANRKNPHFNIHKNYKRVAEVWMDEYKEYLYDHSASYRDIDPGDLSEQKAIRERLQCKPFKWFMQKVAFDLLRIYPAVVPQPFAHGQVWNEEDEDLCLKLPYLKETISLQPCEEDPVGHQNLELTYLDELKVKGSKLCADVAKRHRKATIGIFNCHKLGDNQAFKYDPETQHIFHKASRMCLDSNVQDKTVYMDVCSPVSRTQQWLWTNVNETLINDHDNHDNHVLV